jgi:hypothetical protein
VGAYFVYEPLLLGVYSSPEEPVRVDISCGIQMRNANTRRQRL